MLSLSARIANALIHTLFTVIVILAFLALEYGFARGGFDAMAKQDRTHAAVSFLFVLAVFIGLIYALPPLVKALKSVWLSPAEDFAPSSAFPS